MDDAPIFSRRFWRGRYDAVAVARMRIALGVVVLYDLLERLRDFHTFYTDRGLISPADRISIGGGIESWSLLQLTSSSTGVGFVWALAIVAFVGVTLGLYTRVCNLVGWVLLLSIQRRMPYVLDGADLVERVVTFWLIFVDSGAALSLDVRLGRRLRMSTVWAFPVRLVQLQIAVVYFFTGIYKVNDVWLGGDAMMRVLHMHEFARAWSAPLIRHPLVLHLLSWTVPFGEIALSLTLLTPWRATRRLALAFAYTLHLGILVLLRVGLFSPVMMAVLLVFVPPRAIADDAPPPSLRWIDRLTGILMLMTVTMQTWALVMPDRELPRALSAPLGVLALNQDWPMFDRPYSTDYVFTARGQLADGHEIDLGEALPELFASSPSLTYGRWVKLRGRMSTATMRSIAARYACRRYNATATMRLRRVEIYFEARDATKATPSPPSPPTLLTVQECLPATTPGDAVRH